MKNLTYSMVTLNKFNSLKNVMQDVIASLEEDEEVIVIDGGSTDGTKEYLEQLRAGGKIAYFVSEPDLGEAHAINKGLLAASGKLIKTLSDDDVFYFKLIKECKKWMLTNEDVDFLATEGCVFNGPSKVGISAYINHYKKWRDHKVPFGFCGIGTMIRKSSLPLIGLYNPNYARVDHEFSLRLLTSGAKVGWFCGYTWCRLPNPKANSGMYSSRIQEETRWLDALYYGKGSGKFTRLEKKKYDKKTTFESEDNSVAYGNAVRWLVEQDRSENNVFLKEA